MRRRFDFTEREMKEILHALLYVKHCNHGTDGHGRLCLIEKMARRLGLDLSEDGSEVTGLTSRTFRDFNGAQTVYELED